MPAQPTVITHDWREAIRMLAMLVIETEQEAPAKVIEHLMSLCLMLLTLSDLTEEQMLDWWNRKMREGAEAFTDAQIRTIRAHLQASRAIDRAKAN
jgi:hypothetical protein